MKLDNLINLIVNNLNTNQKSLLLVRALGSSFYDNLIKISKEDLDTSLTLALNERWKYTPSKYLEKYYNNLFPKGPNKPLGSFYCKHHGYHNDDQYCSCGAFSTIDGSLCSPFSDEYLSNPFND